MYDMRKIQNFFYQFKRDVSNGGDLVYEQLKRQRRDALRYVVWTEQGYNVEQLLSQFLPEPPVPLVVRSEEVT